MQNRSESVFYPQTDNAMGRITMTKFAHDDNQPD